MPLTMQMSSDGLYMAIIHLVVKNASGEWRCACVPDVTDLAGWQRTDDARAATCPMCKETETYKRVNG